MRLRSSSLSAGIRRVQAACPKGSLDWRQSAECVRFPPFRVITLTNHRAATAALLDKVRNRTSHHRVSQRANGGYRPDQEEFHRYTTPQKNKKRY